MKTTIMHAAENDHFATQFGFAPESVASLMQYFEGALATPAGRAALLANPEEFVKAEVSRWNDLCGNWLRELAEMKTPRAILAREQIAKGAWEVLTLQK